MTIKHHPSTETLIELATGRLDLGRSIVVAAHVEACPECARNVRLMEAVGGILLTDADPEPMAADAFAHGRARVDAMEHEVVPEAQLRPTGDMPYLPQAARGYPAGQWKWIGPGIHRRIVELPAHSGARVFLLRARPGTRMPDHTHTGTEFTLVLAGAFIHAHGRFGPGDFEEADDSVDHQPVVEAGETCICLVALEGTLRLKGLTGRLLQPFVQI
jgi:putative transcriptional regulator